MSDEFSANGCDVPSQGESGRLSHLPEERPMRSHEAPVRLESILCTGELQHRPLRPPDFQSENRALVVLAQALADSPHTVLQTLTDTILEVLQCGSAGLSLLTTHDGGKRFYWPAIAGEWKSHIGGGTPREFGPCGDVLDRDAPLLFRRPQRRYTYLQPVAPPVEECLLVPFYVDGKAVGTIWAVAHDDRRLFDGEDLRQLISLSRFASGAYQAVTTLDASKQLAAIVESSDDAIIGKDLNGIIKSWNGGAERIFGYTAQEAVGQPIIMLLPPERLDEEPRILERLRRGEHIDHFETVRRRKDGSLVDISLTVSPIFDGHGRPIGASKIARDVSAQKRAESDLQKARIDLEKQVADRTRELQGQVQETRRAEEGLSALTGRLLHVQDEERRRLARELHDSAGQSLAALSMNLAAMKTAQAAELDKKVKESSDLVDTLAKEIRTLSYLLHPPLLDEAGLSSAMSWYVQGFSERSGIQVELDLDAHFGRLSSDLEMGIFRLVQESLTNIHRHSGSSSARIRVTRSETQVEVEISDKGKGISPERQQELTQSAGGVGLRGMRERVRQLGGRFEMTSSGGGTRITVVLPAIASAASA